MTRAYASPKPPGAAYPPGPNPSEDCCSAVECFERPVYFCGHLLTDTDLSLDQRYHRGKDRLYHRTLHGHGIVCGLRLTCDPDHAGRVLVGDGFAIDACGNDLVVCRPYPFDVVEVLRDKCLLVKPKPRPKGDGPNMAEDGAITQCFHVVIRYAEEPSDYTTPLGGSGCESLGGGCEPTRVREVVVFDVVEDLPSPDDPLNHLRDRIEGCFRLFTDGPFARALQDGQGVLRKIADGGEGAVRPEGAGPLYDKLRALLLLYLEKYPDEYDCTLVDSIKNTQPGRDGDFARAICALLNLAWRSAVDCALGELVPVCREPECPDWVVLGTVEVVNGRVVRVCNCPRSYLWSFANLAEVLVATLYGGLACEEKKGDAAGQVCCRAPEQQDCAWFLNLLTAVPKAPGQAASEPVVQMSRLRDSLRSAFDFTRAGVFSPRAFEGMDTGSLQKVFETLGVAPGLVTVAPPDARGKSSIEILEALGLITKTDRLLLSEEAGHVDRASIDRSRPTALRHEDQQALDKAGADAKEALAKSEAVTALKAQVDALQKALDELRTRLPAAPAAPAETPAAPGGPTTPPARPGQPEVPR